MKTVLAALLLLILAALSLEGCGELPTEPPPDEPIVTTGTPTAVVTRRPTRTPNPCDPDPCD